MAPVVGSQLALRELRQIDGQLRPADRRGLDRRGIAGLRLRALGSEQFQEREPVGRVGDSGERGDCLGVRVSEFRGLHSARGDTGVSGSTHHFVSGVF